MATQQIDTTIWITQQALANELQCSVQRVHNWIKRNKVQSKKIEGSRLVLVDRTSVILEDMRKTK